MAKDKTEAVPAGTVEAKFAWAAEEVARFMSITGDEEWSGDTVVRPAEARDVDCMAALVAVAAFFAAQAGYDPESLKDFAAEYQRRMVTAMVEGT
jgi:hypothetical protein